MQLSSMRIATKLMIAVAIPFFALLALTGYNLTTRWNERSEMINLGQLAAGVADVSRLVHELQRERGLSTVFVGSKGGQLREELPQQRQLTNERRRAAVDFLAAQRAAATGDYRAAIVAAESAVAELEAKRKQIDAFSITAPDSYRYFTQTIAALLAVSSEISKVSDNGNVATVISGYAAFMQGKERAGQERVTGASGVSAGKFDIASFARVLSLRAEQQAYFDTFEASATAAQRDFFKKTMSGRAVQDVARMRDIIAAGGLSGDLRGLEVKAWFDATTARIDLLKVIEDRISADLNTLAAGIQAEATKSLSLLAGIVAVVLVLCAIFVFVIARDIAVPMQALTGGMRQLADGNFDVVLPGVRRKDEVGDIARAVDAFKLKLEEKMRLDAERSRKSRAASRRNVRSAPAGTRKWPAWWPRSCPHSATGWRIWRVAI